MTQYIPEYEGIYYSFGNNYGKILETIATTYIGCNPALPFIFRSYSSRGFPQQSDGRYDIDLSTKYPNEKFGSYAYAFGMIWSEKQSIIEAPVNCYGPTRICVNRKLVFQSGVVQEVNKDIREMLLIELKSGWNGIYLCMKNVASGFGCIFGSNRGGVSVMAPFFERKGWGGWVYSQPVDKDIFQDYFPEVCSREAETGIIWYPSLKWNEVNSSKPILTRIFNIQIGEYAYAWTKINTGNIETQDFQLSVSTQGFTVIWINGVEVFSSTKGGSYSFEISLSYGKHDLLILSSAAPGGRSVEIHLPTDNSGCYFEKPHPIEGIEDPWLYLGPFTQPLDYIPQDIQDLYRVFNSNKGNVYWQIDAPQAWVRPYSENNSLFAIWNYPLGVTLSGLLTAGKILERQDIKKYVISHFSECIRLYEYSLWDKEQYGFPATNQKLVEMKMLDDCGSMGATLLEVYGEIGDRRFITLADSIADYISNKQERRADGAFYRISKGYFMENTLWADDLYMSTPFLMRYFRLTGNTRYINDAAAQFLLYKKYLYMENLNLMSHIYDFKYETPTFIPWGRGNGWPLFSLSQLLEYLPENHNKRSELLSFFCSFCAGVLKYQGENGLWHQILTDPESYEETSCTAMFIYAISRGIRYNWLPGKSIYIHSVQKAWEGLTKYTIDKKGNIHGVCRGSRYSFDPEYYKKELLWTTNDTHGIGIVLLAGVELMLMTDSLNT